MATELRFDFVCPKTKGDFIASSEGLFCTECQKPVVDFTGKKQPEIVEALRAYTEMPCVWIPVDALHQPTPVTTPWWSPWRKSAALLALFLLLGNVKALFAQTKAHLKPNDNKKMTTPLGYQKVTFTGTIKDQENLAIGNAELRFTFLEQTVGYGKTDENGFFKIDVENYGGIREVDIKVTAPDCEARSFENISITKPEPVFSTELHRYSGNIIYGNRYTMMAGGIGYYEIVRSTSFYERDKASIDIFGHPLVQFDTQAPEYLNEKLTYEAQVADMNGTGIPGARIEMRFANNQTREGFAGERGLVLMNMQLEGAALHANILISAPGYYPKTVPFYEFDKQHMVHKLVKKPVEKPEEATETVVEPAVTETSKESEITKAEIAETARILLYPNPANETVSINLPGAYNATVQVSDGNGRIVLRKSSFRQISVMLDTQPFPVGTYTVQVTCNGAVYHEKLLIVR